MLSREGEVRVGRLVEDGAAEVDARNQVEKEEMAAEAERVRLAEVERGLGRAVVRLVGKAMALTIGIVLPVGIGIGVLIGWLIWR